MFSTRSFTTRSASCILTWPFILPAMLPDASSTIITLERSSARAAGAVQASANARATATTLPTPIPGLLIATDLRLCPSLGTDGSADRASRPRPPDRRAHRARRHGGRLPRRAPPAARAACAEGDPPRAVRERARGGG